MISNLDQWEKDFSILHACLRAWQASLLRRTYRTSCTTTATNSLDEMALEENIEMADQNS